MGVEPPDDPGGRVPSVGMEIIIDDTSSMDTEDGSSQVPLSAQQKLDRKRVRALRKVCKNCNKKRKKRDGKNVTGNGLCICDDSDETKRPLLSTIPDPSIPIPSQTDQPSQPLAQRQNGRKYVSTDLAPYVVHIQKEQSSPNDPVSLHPIEFGRFLKKNCIMNIVNGSLKRIGRNRLSMAFSTCSDANSFIENQSLSDQKLKAFIPTYNVTRMGVVRGVPSDWTDEDVLDNISVPIGCGKVIKCRRIRRKNVFNGTAEFTNTETVILTFDGQVLPKRIFMCYTPLTVDLYIYPTIQCYNCCRFGHTKPQCRSKPRCFKCGQGHTADSCSIEQEEATCCLCSGYHYATDKACPEFCRQKNIKISMAQNSISYLEAIKLHPAVSKSFADVLRNSQSKQDETTAARISPTSSSHKKTVFLKPRVPPKSSGGYDRAAHSSLTREYNMPLSSTNGTALKRDEPENEKSTIEKLISILIELLSKSNLIHNNPLPSHVADLIETTLSKNKSQHGSSPSTVEQ